MSGFGEVAKFSFLMIVANIVLLAARLTSSNPSIVSVGQLLGSGNPILVFVALIIMLYSIVVVYDAASYFRDYDSHTCGIAVTIAKVLIASVGLGLLAFIMMVVAPFTGLTVLLSFAFIALEIIGNLGLGYFIYLLGEIHERGYPVPPRSLFTIAAATWTIEFFIGIVGLVSVIILFYVSRKATMSLNNKINNVYYE